MEYWYRYRDDLWKCVTTFQSDAPPPRGIRIHDEKTADNIRRAQRMIEGYALCNDWQWFGTFTLDPRYRSRSDLDGFRTDFQRFIRNERRNYPELRVLLVPELHKKGGAWHMHGLIQGLPTEALRAFSLHERLPAYLRLKVRTGNAVYDWTRYRETFGFVDLEPVRNRDAAARYITKYVTKGMDSTAKHLDLGKHMYYASRGLNAPVLMGKENASGAVPEAFPDDLFPSRSFTYEYGTVQWYERRPHK